MMMLKERSISDNPATPPLKDNYSSTGAKFFFHEEAMRGLRTGKARCVTTHLMPEDRCNHKCSFCSVLTREGNALDLDDMMEYLDILIPYGLRSVILSGGGNPIMYRCRKSGANFNDLVKKIVERKLEIGLITNGLPMKEYEGGRKSWKTVSPKTLDSLKWCRISMSGLDHKEREVFVPDFDPSKTTLGFSYILHDRYDCPTEKNHGSVSTVSDLIRFGGDTGTKPILGKDRIPVLTEQIRGYVDAYSPRYVRLLPNCLEISKIPERCDQLQGMADAINPNVCFVQRKPPAAPNKCFLGLIHPVLNSDGYVYPCDSVVLQEEAVHKFANPWRIAHWRDVAQLYERPVKSLIDNPGEICRGCVFTGSNLLLEKVVDGTIDITPTGPVPEHVNFV